MIYSIEGTGGEEATPSCPCLGTSLLKWENGWMNRRMDEQLQTGEVSISISLVYWYTYYLLLLYYYHPLPLLIYHLLQFTTSRLRVYHTALLRGRDGRLLVPA